MENLSEEELREAIRDLYKSNNELLLIPLLAQPWFANRNYSLQVVEEILLYGKSDVNMKNVRVHLINFLHRKAMESQEVLLKPLLLSGDIKYSYGIRS